LLDELESRVVCGDGRSQHYCSIAARQYRNVKCYVGTGFSSLDLAFFMVKNALDQLTESRGSNEDKL